LWLFDYEAESYSFFCDNPLTKKIDPPIGFLGHNEKECEFFEWAQVGSSAEGSVPQSLPCGRDFDVINPRLGLS